jgi:predicted dehydrogenase
MIKEKKFGELREFIATNSQNQGDPSQWRLKQELAGGGCVPDVGVYCINAARFMSREEPTEISATVIRPTNDARFKEVESLAQFTLKFPSGFMATCSCSYDTHRSQFLRIQGTKGWAELDPAFAYTGLQMRYRLLEGKRDTSFTPSIEAKDQFTEETDHMAECILNDKMPHTPGEEGLQDQRIVDAIYESARTGKVVSLTPPSGSVRGPEPEEES